MSRMYTELHVHCAKEPAQTEMSKPLSAMLPKAEIRFAAINNQKPRWRDQTHTVSSKPPHKHNKDDTWKSTTTTSACQIFFECFHGIET